MNVKFQSNYGSILGVYGMSSKSTIKKMLKNNLVDFLGSDVHREKSIYPKIPKALDKISKIVSRDYLNQIINDNAEIILSGEEL